MAPQSDAITGGTVLRIPALQSPNFVTGVSGWIIRADGTCEFNAGTFRGSIEVGPSGGPNFFVNNPSTGDVIDIYNGSAQLVYSIDSSGIATSYASSGGQSLVVGSGTLIFETTHSDSETTIDFTPSLSNLQGNFAIQIFDANQDINETGTLTIFSGNSTGSLRPTVQATERSVSGSVVVSDKTSVNNLVHDAVYSVAFTSGAATFAHGCQFTPVGGVGSGVHTGSTSPGGLQCGSFTGTNVTVSGAEPSGTTLPNATYQIALHLFG
jgi:hypothetical protein